MADSGRSSWNGRIDWSVESAHSESLGWGHCDLVTPKWRYKTDIPYRDNGKGQDLARVCADSLLPINIRRHLGRCYSILLRARRDKKEGIWKKQGFSQFTLSLPALEIGKAVTGMKKEGPFSCCIKSARVSCFLFFWKTNRKYQTGCDRPRKLSDQVGGHP